MDVPGMNRTKIDYAIALGNSKSSIARMDNGEARNIMSDNFQSDTSNCVHFNKKGVCIVGQKALNLLDTEAVRACKNTSSAGSRNTFIDFMRTMGTDEQYFSSNMGRAYSSEELVAEVLKKLKSYVRDDDPQAVVITVPAKFQQHQVAATNRAAALAGFQHCALPTVSPRG